MEFLGLFLSRLFAGKPVVVQCCEMSAVFSSYEDGGNKVSEKNFSDQGEELINELLTNGRRQKTTDGGDV